MDRPERYRKRPVVIEAILWEGPGPGTAAVIDWCGYHDGDLLVFVPLAYPRSRLWVAANQDWIEVDPPVWIAKDAAGFYPIRPEIFAATYEPDLDEP